MPVDPDVEDRFQKFIAEPTGARRQPRTAEEEEALLKLLAMEERLKKSQFALPKSPGKN